MKAALKFSRNSRECRRHSGEVNVDFLKICQKSTFLTFIRIELSQAVHQLSKVVTFQTKCFHALQPLTIASQNRTPHMHPRTPASNLAIVIIQTIFDGINRSMTNISNTQPDMPPGDDAVMKTFVFSVLYLASSVDPIVTFAIAICKTQKRLSQLFISLFAYRSCVLKEREGNRS